MVGHRVIERALTPQRQQLCGRERARGHAIVVEVLPRCAHCAARTATLRLQAAGCSGCHAALLMCVAARRDGRKVVGGSRALRGSLRQGPRFSHLFCFFFFLFLRMIAHSHLLSLSRARTQATTNTVSFRGLSLYDDDEYLVRFEARDSLIFSAGQGSARTRLLVAL